MGLSAPEERVFIGDFTRKEFRERMEAGVIKAAIVPISSTEQHQEHLHMAHDHLHANYMAEQIAKAMLPNVVVATPINIGVSEHHMTVGPGTLTVRPEIFCEFVFDVCDSLVRTGITNILILNGHGGNVKPMMYRIDEYRERLSNIYKSGKMAGSGVNYRGPPGQQTNSASGGGPAMPQPGRSDSGSQPVNLRFQSYWDIYDPAFVAEHMVAGNAPGHACEYETSTMLHLFPDRVSVEDIDQNRPERHANAEKGGILIKNAIAGNVKLLTRMIMQEEFDQPPVTFRDGDAMHMITGDVVVQLDMKPSAAAARL